MNFEMFNQNCRNNTVMYYMENLSPFYKNLILSQCIVVYYKIALEILLRWSGIVIVSSTTTISPPPVVVLANANATTQQNSLLLFHAKQYIYMTLSSTIIFWPLFDQSDWSWRFNIIVPLAMFLRFVYKGAFRKNAEDIEVQILSPRSSMPSDLLFGPTQFSIVMIYVGLYQFMTIEGIVIISSIGIGDSIAPIIGKWFARHFYTINPLGSTKTMEGSIFGVFLGTVTSIYVFLYILRIPLLPLRIILSYSAIAAMVEATSPSNMDNLLIPLVIHFSMDRVQQWLPE